MFMLSVAALHMIVVIFFCRQVHVLTILQSTSRSPSGFDCAPPVLRLLSVVSLGFRIS